MHWTFEARPCRSFSFRVSSLQRAGTSIVELTRGEGLLERVFWTPTLGHLFGAFHGLFSPVFVVPHTHVLFIDFARLGCGGITNVSRDIF